MSYAYGMKSGPAVGNGLPGLPRRQPLERKKQTSGIDLSNYSIIRLDTRRLSLLNHSFQLMNQVEFSYDVSDFCKPGISEDQRYIGVSTDGRLTVYETSNLDVVFSLTYTGSSSLKGAVAINNKLGMLALGGDKEVNFYRISDLKASDGGSINDVAAVYTHAYNNGYNRGRVLDIEWNPQGTLLTVVGRPGLGRDNEYARAYILKWPSMEEVTQLYERLSSANRNRGGCYFTKDGRLCVVMAGNADTANLSSTNLIVDITYDDNGEYLSHVRRFVGSKIPGFASVFGAKAVGEDIYYLDNYDRLTLTKIQSDGTESSVPILHADISERATPYLRTIFSADGKVFLSLKSGSINDLPALNLHFPVPNVESEILGGTPAGILYNKEGSTTGLMGLYLLGGL